MGTAAQWLERRERPAVAVVTMLSGLLALSASAAPTGAPWPDAFILFATATTVTWLGTGAPWWALLAAAGTSLVTAVDRPLPTLAAVTATALAARLALTNRGTAAERAVIAAIATQCALHIRWDPFFLSSALIAGGVGALLAVTGLAARAAPVQLRLRRLAVVFGAAAVVVFVGLAVAAALARPDASSGYRHLVKGLEHVQGGRRDEARVELRLASVDLRRAERDLSAAWAAPARFVPVLSQHERVLTDILLASADAADEAALALDSIDTEFPVLEAGALDLAAVESLVDPLRRLATAADDLGQALDDARSPWLVGPLQNRLTTARERTADVLRQTVAARDAADRAPDILGASGTARWLVVVTDPTEARGQSGTVRTWAEVEIDQGRLRLTQSGTTADLIEGLRRITSTESGLQLLADREFFDTFGRYGAGAAPDATGGGAPVDPLFWRNVTMTPDASTAASVMAQMYTAASGQSLTGVVVMDPAAIAAVLDLTGPTVIPATDPIAGAPTVFSAATAEQVLTVDALALPSPERDDLVLAATTRLVGDVLSRGLPGLHAIADRLGPAARAGHLTVWTASSTDRRMLELVGLTGGLPDRGGGDGLAVVTNNAAGNRLDGFLQRSVRYSATYRSGSGAVEAVAAVTLVNNAPNSQWPADVIGNMVGLPRGTNRTLVSVYSPLGLVSAQLNGESVALSATTDGGWNVYSSLVTLAPGERITLRLELAGRVASGPYRLVVRPQPGTSDSSGRAEATVTPYLIDVSRPGGASLATFSGPLEYPSLIGPSGAVTVDRER